MIHTELLLIYWLITLKALKKIAVLITLLDALVLCSLLLFVDEADAFLRKRATVSSAAVPYAW